MSIRMNSIVPTTVAGSPENSTIPTSTRHESNRSDHDMINTPTSRSTDHHQNKDLELGLPDKMVVDYMQRAQWLRASVLGANDGLVSVASLMIGVGAASTTSKAMLVSGLAGLVAGACSMAIGEFVSVYTQYDIEKTLIKQGVNNNDVDSEEIDKEPLANPLQAAGASALAFSIGGLLPLLAGAFIKSFGARLGAVCGVSSLGLVAFGAIGALLGGAKPYKGAIRVLVGGWLAMLITYGILKAFSLLFHVNISSSG